MDIFFLTYSRIESYRPGTPMGEGNITYISSFLVPQPMISPLGVLSAAGAADRRSRENPKEREDMGCENKPAAVPPERKRWWAGYLVFFVFDRPHKKSHGGR